MSQGVTLFCLLAAIATIMAFHAHSPIKDTQFLGAYAELREGFSMLV